ncbi:hypothetical protein [Zoogloea sp.]|uniref:hypothetical protein n=1 Tax=Zoogloea sp. TaxID=49181 RepID=UPI0011D46873|nr:hypothetical protein [Zoogloea sp.]MBK6656198.1 hypothetical protein [Zoogloea sp.]MBK7848847.1 hypothetical protein [Zoogloea sp.]MBP7443456.1 hypothetical protein [Zoogloea sp.]TXG93048.1 MAG: hypothetical protein E6R15_10440 [Zoogloea sp.]HOY00575.1 hypothetical protein [Zoogloea sp.]
MKPVRFLRLPLATVVAGMLGGCSTIGEPPHDWLLLPAAAVAAVHSGYIKIPAALAGVAVYALVDPLAPNWAMQEARLAEDRFRIVLRMKALHAGGDGEARQVFARRAAQLASQPGFEAYDIVSWEEGIESTRPFAQRVAWGEIRLRRQPVPMAALRP